MRKCSISVIAVLALSCFIFFSCKKKKNDNPFGNARIALVDLTHGGSVIHYRIYYDAYSNIDSMSMIGDGLSAGYFASRKFRYVGTSYTITDQAGSVLTIFANSANQILKICYPDTISLTYNGSQLASREAIYPVTYYPYYMISRTNYTWVNGDMTRDSTTGGAGTNVTSYDLTRNGQPADAIRVKQFLELGRSYIKTTHLPINVSHAGAWNEKYFYQFDGSGRISQLLVVDENPGATSDSIVYSYTYY